MMSNSEQFSSITPVAYNVRLDNEKTAHPHLHITLPASFLDPPQTESHQCEPFLLIRLPPALFIDPFTFPIARRSPNEIIQNQNRRDEKHVEEEDVAPRAIVQDRQVIKEVQILTNEKGISKVELERGIGYSIINDAINKQSNMKDSESLIEEYSAYLISLYRFKTPSLLRKQHQASYGGEAVSAESERKIDSKGQQVEFDIPLHTRYPIPQGSPIMDLNSLMTYDWQKLVQSILLPSKSSYYTTLLEFPHAFWTCKGDGLMAVDSGLYESVSQSDLLAPMHNHLKFPLKPSLSTNDQFYSLLPPLGTSREPFRIHIPMGQADLAIILNIVTTTFLILSSIFIISHTSSAFRKVRKSETQ